MSVVMVGIGGIGSSNKQGDVVKTMALGSCVAVIFLIPKSRAVGMAHIALPSSDIARERSLKLPGYFADTGVEALIKEFKKYNATKPSELIIKLAGGACIMDPEGRFNIGKRNILAIRKMLWKYRLGATAEDVGANYSRSVRVEVDTGNVIISSPSRGEWTL